VVQLIAVSSRRFDIRSSYKLLKFFLSFSNFYRRKLRRSSSYQFLQIDFHRRFGNGTTKSVPLAIRDCHRFSNCVMRAHHASCVVVLRYISREFLITSCRSRDCLVHARDILFVFSLPLILPKVQSLPLNTRLVRFGKFTAAK